ncbi:uncharacterized protein LOC129923638 [Biomphalaria glabrata]|uniref:Uncharacterized protein LOC129923638 n=1 Tax=Biomphalaria glabrata TaxID=6526 RepID=A0A9W2Z9C3_BIOGL|nr:uncharacterized protein LOC129923638 [Biomphalaria glabrata]
MKSSIILKSLFLFFLCFTCFELTFYVKHFMPIKKMTILNIKKHILPAVNNRALLNAISNASFFKVDTKEATENCKGENDEERLRVFRELLRDIVHGSLQSVRLSPEDIPNTVHFTWCGSKKFRFADSIGFLSFVRLLRPVKIIFHYNELPKFSLYDMWFQELRQSLPQLVLRHTNKQLRCGTIDSLNFALEQLAASVGGGIYFGERAALTYIPESWKQLDQLTYMVAGSVSSEQMIVYSKFGLINKTSTFEMYREEILNKTYHCVNLEQFNKQMEQYSQVPQFDKYIISPCLVLPEKIYPENIINVSSPFAEVARTFFYGTPRLMGAKQSQDPNDVIPAISHYISLAKDNKSVEWTFSHYMSILSALYVGGFQRVYVHGDQVPVGEWWRRLQTENVTFVFIENIETVYQQKVRVLAHQSDILRSLILMKYGGAYQDRDVIWGNPVSEEIRKYPTLMSYDWPDYGEWPRAINMGVLMSRAKSPFLYTFLDTFWLEKDADWGYNGILMPYKVFEMNPESVYIYEQLQIICYINICHPTWHPDYIRPYSDSEKPTGNFSLNEPLAYHFTYPKPDPSLVSFDTIRNGTNIAAQIAQRTIKAVEKAGKFYLLK